MADTTTANVQQKDVAEKEVQWYRTDPNADSGIIPVYIYSK
jgi:hypothetical protein